MRHGSLSLLTALTLALIGCGGGAKDDAHKDHDHSTDTAHKDEGKDAHKGEHDHGKLMELGEGTFGKFTVKAARVEGAIKAGEEAMIDVEIEPASGAAKVTAVRFWIGTEDAAGSAKGKAELEDPSDPHGWHGHAEAPKPLPAGAKLWVEIADDAGNKTLASFDLKA